MAIGTIDVTMKVDKELRNSLAKLVEYKSVADEALSALNEVVSTDPEIIRIQEITLRALIIGATI
jgi:hypothetical protein